MYMVAVKSVLICFSEAWLSRTDGVQRVSVFEHNYFYCVGRVEWWKLINICDAKCNLLGHGVQYLEET